MAKPEEEQRDQLFDMNVGDGLIEVNVEEKPVEKTAEEIAAAGEKLKVEPKVGDASIYEDGTFEINDTPSENAASASADEQQEFIDKDENKDKNREIPGHTALLLPSRQELPPFPLPRAKLAHAIRHEIILDETHLPFQVRI